MTLYYSDPDAAEVVIQTKKSKMRRKNVSGLLDADMKWLSEQVFRLARSSYRVKVPAVVTGRQRGMSYTLKAVMSKKEGMEVILPEDGGKPVRYTKE